MKFGYSYKTSDGSRHEATFEARAKEDVFSSLRAKGIKPIKVWEIHGKFYASPRTCVIVLLSIALIVSLAFIIRSIVTSANYNSSSLPRHQIYGDPVVLEDLEREGYASIFPEKGDQILAAFAIPGRPIAQDIARSLSRQAIIKAIDSCKDTDIEVVDTEPFEVKELKRIVNGIKAELRWYLADGVGTVGTYWNRLVERQAEELRIYERARQEVELSTDPKLRLKRNESLRAMGLKTIPRNFPVDK